MQFAMKMHTANYWDRAIYVLDEMKKRKKNNSRNVIE